MQLVDRTSARSAAGRAMLKPSSRSGSATSKRALRISSLPWRDLGSFGSRPHNARVGYSPPMDGSGAGESVGHRRAQPLGLEILVIGARPLWQAVGARRPLLEPGITVGHAPD